MSVLQRFDKFTIQALGFAFIVLGIFLFMLGLIDGPELSTSCPANGCPPVSLPWYWWVPTASFFSGITLVMVGIVLLIVARGMKPKQETDVAIPQTPASR